MTVPTRPVLSFLDAVKLTMIKIYDTMIKIKYYYCTPCVAIIINAKNSENFKQRCRENTDRV